MTEAIHAANVVVSIGRHTVLEHVSFDVSAGRTAALLGSQGAGKSTFIHALLGRLRRSSGDLSVCGIDPAVSPTEVAKRTTYVGQPSVLEPHLTTLENVAHLLELAAAPVPKPIEITKALRDVDVPDRVIAARSSRAKGLVTISVWLAIAQLRASELVLLDEPTEFLNPSDSAHLASLIHEVTARGTAVLVTTRDARFAEECASTVYLLESGRLSIASRSRSPVAAP